MDTIQQNSSKQRVDGQMTGLAGELFVAAELLKRGLQTAITFSNAKTIDLFAVNLKTKRNFTIQVKAVRQKTSWPISHEKIHAEHVYVFVLLNEPGQPVEYFVVPGSTLTNDPDLFRLRDYPKFPGIVHGTLKKLGFADAWHIFDEPTVDASPALRGLPHHGR
jgi:hypothetical protein